MLYELVKKVGNGEEALDGLSLVLCNEELNRLAEVIGVIDERGHGRRGAFWT